MLFPFFLILGVISVWAYMGYQRSKPQIVRRFQRRKAELPKQLLADQWRAFEQRKG